jgi:glucose/arabinose dehydrogenase
MQLRPSSSKRNATLSLRRVLPGLVLSLWVLALGTTSRTATNARAEVPLPVLNPADILLPDGYRIEVVAAGLNAPSVAVFDGSDLIVVESGWENVAPPRILRIRPDGGVSVIASTGLLPPVMGLALWHGRLYVSHRGKVSLVQPDGKLRDILTGLPSEGDNPNNNLVFGPDGQIYLGQGTVTNAGVVGMDSYTLGWLQTSPGLSEIPCEDVTMLGQNYQTPNPLSQDGPMVLTGAYRPFGVPATPDEIVKGDLKCGGSILRFSPDGGGLTVVAWGLRDPFGLKFDQSGQLWVTNHGTDVRGSRVVSGDPDSFVRVTSGGWYGWPDYMDGLPITGNRFKAPGRPEPGFLWEDHPSLNRAYLTFAPQSGANGFDFSPGGRFGYQGDAFVAMFGTFPPFITEGEPPALGGRIVRVDMNDKQVHDFASNRVSGSLQHKTSGGFDRPSDILFGPDQSLYVIDWGATGINAKGVQPAPSTGAIWRMYPKGDRAVRPGGPIAIPSPWQSPAAGQLAAAPSLTGANQDIVRIISLILGSFVVVLAVMILARRYLGLR